MPGINKSFQEFSSSYWEEVWKETKLPQTIIPEDIPDYHHLFRTHLPPSNGRRTLIEIGCAPGRWLSYFYKQFGYLVTGLDYAPNAIEITKRNLALLNIEAEVINQEFIAYRNNMMRFDVVFSMGFIEHFINTNDVLARMVELLSPDSGYIVTIIPNLLGLGGLISKTFRPRVFYGHVPISLSGLISSHEESGVKTLFADYVGGYYIDPLLEKNTFSVQHPNISNLVNLPIRALNRIVRNIETKANRFPRSTYLSPSLIYIGHKLAGK
jgi:cyclopropane fatty-acyl-phospholipid synthase-like methyltransferase